MAIRSMIIVSLLLTALTAVGCNPADAPTEKKDEPKAEAPKIEAPKVEAPEVEAPKVEAPEVEAPEVEAPEVEAPEVEAPKVEAPKVEAPEEEAPVAAPDDASEKDRAPAPARLAEAERKVSNKTIVGVLGSEFGAGGQGADLLVGGAPGRMGSGILAGADGGGALIAEEKKAAPTTLPTADPGGEEYQHVNENPFKKALEEPVSTFSIDVDTASYANVRRFINSGQLPPPDAVRIEELVNYFRYDYAQPDGDAVPFAVHATITDCPWAPKHRLARVALQGREVETADLPPINLVFLLDVSGSMNDPDKLPLLKAGLVLLLEKLRPTDRVAIVVYAGAAGLVLPSTPGTEKTTILAALDALRAGGSTAGGAGINLAYQVAKDHFIEGGNNRVILGTDGDFNVGVSGTDALVRLIEEKRKDGIFLTVLGFGRGNYHDAQMEQLADKGNGNFAYIDSIKEAKKVLSTEFGGTLFTIAKDVKLQIEFNPAKVESYRLIGYENRVMAREDFDDDKKDAGELGSGHRVTAFYELVPAAGTPGAADETRYTKTTIKEGDATAGELMLVKLRWKAPDSDTSTKIEAPVLDAGIPFSKTDRDLQFAAAVAAFGMVLKGSAHKGDATFELVKELAAPALGEDPEGLRKEFLALVDVARGAMRPEPRTPPPSGPISDAKKIKARVRSGQLSQVSGGTIDTAAVKKYLRQRSIVVKHCYEKALKTNPGIMGRLVLELTVKTNGRATAAVASDSVGDPAVATCIQRKIEAWRFPKPDGEAAVLRVFFVLQTL